MPANKLTLTTPDARLTFPYGGAVDIQPWHPNHPYMGDAVDGETRRLDCGSLAVRLGCAIVFHESAKVLRRARAKAA
jgi:hypothetical protein